jgi:hypothetical protein
LGLDILRAYDASVDIGRQTLRLAEEEIPLWSPGVGPRPSSLVVAKEVPKEGAVVEPVKGRKKRHRGRKRREEPKELTREICGSRKELADASRKMTRRAGVARREGNFVREYSTRENVAPKSGKDGRLEAGTETTRSNYILGANGQPAESTGIPSGWKS